MTRLYFVRHADAYDLETGLQLESYPLNNFGRVQALQLAKRLKDNKFDAMYCSRIRRSMETCEIVNSEHKMDVVYTSALNEVGKENWPQPGVKRSIKDIEDFEESIEKIYGFYEKFAKRHHGQEVIIFTHGNWIRCLLTKILANGNPETFCKFVIHNTSLTIIDVDELGFEYVISIADAAHTHLYKSKI